MQGVAPVTAIAHTDDDVDGDKALTDALLDLGIIPRILGIGMHRGVVVHLRLETDDTINIHRLAIEAGGFLVIAIQNGVSLVAHRGINGLLARREQEEKECQK